ncbi:PqqD family protein (plasmid) [Bacillus sp. F19]|nr:PqqD family protein [Bacillus sp. F19]
MLTNKSIPTFPVDVVLQENCIEDLGLEKQHKIDRMAFYMLSKIDGKKTIEDLIEEIHDHYSDVKKKQIEIDLMNVFRLLEQHHLINFANKLQDILLSYFVTLSNRKYIPSAKRYNIQTLSFPAMILFVLVRCTAQLFPLMIIVTLLSSIPFLVSKEAEALTVIFYSLCIFFAIVVSISIHETSHLYFLRRSLQKKSIGFLKIGFMSFKIVRPAVNEQLIVAVSGPMITGGFGIVEAWACLLISDPFFHLVGLICSGIFLIHLLNLLPFFNDGSKLYNEIFEPRNKITLSPSKLKKKRCSF